ncbi:putative disease resistance protein RGA3 [Panicum virgatum]|nr:putative disease resistance protein RGA3 [Panicum virgatum]
MGGVGNTTLAKMVYNNHIIQKHFELKMWHCVSENFEAIPLVRSIIELATNSRCDLPDTIELLQRRLQEAIGRKRFLLILDDVWNEDQHKWEDDLKPLLCSSIGGSGSMIVVTSRSRQVASIMGTFPPHELVCLSEDDSWELFSKKAFSNGVQEQAELAMIGRRIVNKCKGLPLALKTMGGLMSSKKQVQEWEAIADSNFSDTTQGKDEVLPMLKLSYKQLSSEMKQCFAFCAVFPKDYEMEKDMLIQLWMANGYIHEEGKYGFGRER